MVDLVRDDVVLAYDDAGTGYPPLVFVHGAACNRRYWYQQVPRFCAAHRVVAVDLRGHGESFAPSERYTVRLFADDLASTCTQLGIDSPVVIGHSLGGLVALDFASVYPGRVAAAALIDSPLLPGGNRAEVVRDLVAGLRGGDPDSALRAYFARLFGRYDDAAIRSWILDQAVLTEPHVTTGAGLGSGLTSASAGFDRIVSLAAVELRPGACRSRPRAVVSLRGFRPRVRLIRSRALGILVGETRLGLRCGSVVDVDRRFRRPPAATTELTGVPATGRKRSRRCMSWGDRVRGQVFVRHRRRA